MVIDKGVNVYAPEQKLDEVIREEAVEDERGNAQQLHRGGVLEVRCKNSPR